MARKTCGITFLHFLLLYHTAFTDEEVSVFIGELGEKIVLPCLDLPLNSTPTVIRWMKDTVPLVTYTPSHPLHNLHFSILNDSSLIINNLMTIDEDVYWCDTEPWNKTKSQRKIQLLVTEGPKNMVIDVKSATSLQNGTKFVTKGSNVIFNCSSMSSPSQNLTWTYEDVALKENTTRVFRSGSFLQFDIFNIQPEDQKNYTCLAQNTVSRRVETRSFELLVYYAPDVHPDCFWHHNVKLDQILFNCSWYGAYPTPTLMVLLESKAGGKPALNISNQTENFEVPLSRNLLYDGQKITCIGEHIAQMPGDKKMCTFTLAAPEPTGPPMVATVEGTNVTLSCSESKSLPPAKTMWLRQQKPITASSKYILVEHGPILDLIIVNATKDDQDFYVCSSENVIGLRSEEVILTVRSSTDKSGIMIGIFISILILAAGLMVGYFLYSRRERICLSFRFSHLSDRNVDVMNLIESEDEDIFQSTVPRLPPLTNGHALTPVTTLVEIHPIQSNEHDDVNDTNTDHHTQDHTRDVIQVHIEVHKDPEEK